MNATRSYVLITPTKNEEHLIGATIESVVRQTILPTEWIIVSDGSTDGTNEIVRAAATAHLWIRLVQLPPREGRSFAAVVRAIEAGIRSVQTSSYSYIGLLDSDVRFQAIYFEKLLELFESAPRLGLAGGFVVDPGQPRDRFPRNRYDVPGAVQFFRRECFHRIGQLIAIPEGGWDALTCARARMLGYETRLVTALVVDHLKPRNVSEGGVIRRKWQMGVRDYALGYHPAFELVKCMARIGDPPPIVGSFAWWLGFCYALIRRTKLMIPQEMVDFVRQEQRHRLTRALWPFG